MPLAIALVAAVTTVVLHFAWEMVQAPAFDDFAASAWAGTLRCLVAALGDLLIASGAYVVTGMAVRNLAWPIDPRWRLPAAMWVALGLFVTIVFERWALAQGRWSYGAEMPVIAGVGLLPLLQWLVVPALSLAVVRRLRARPWLPL